MATRAVVKPREDRDVAVFTTALPIEHQRAAGTLLNKLGAAVVGDRNPELLRDGLLDYVEALSAVSAEELKELVLSL